MSAARKNEVPVNTGWFFSNQHNYAPRGTTLAIHAELARLILRRDEQLREMVRNCPARWYVTVQLGRDTLHLNLYTEDEIHSRQRCAERDLSLMAIFSVDRDMDLQSVNAELLSTSYPRHYGVRSLTSEEQIYLNVMQSAFDEHGVDGYYAKTKATVDGMLHLMDSTPAFDTGDFLMVSPHFNPPAPAHQH